MIDSEYTVDYNDAGFTTAGFRSALDSVDMENGAEPGEEADNQFDPPNLTPVQIEAHRAMTERAAQVAEAAWNALHPPIPEEMVQRLIAEQSPADIIQFKPKAVPHWVKFKKPSKKKRHPKGGLF